MKILFIMLSLSYALFASNAADAAKLLGAENDYSTAITKAQTEKKMLVMVIVKENCRWCDKLVNKTLSDENIQTELKHYILLIVDKDDAFPSDFKENFFPSIFYIDYSSKKSVYENVGFVGTKCFLNDLKESLKTRDALYK